MSDETTTPPPQASEADPPNTQPNKRTSRLAIVGFVIACIAAGLYGLGYTVIRTGEPSEVEIGLGFCTTGMGIGFVAAGTLVFALISIVGSHGRTGGIGLASFGLVIALVAIVPTLMSIIAARGQARIASRKNDLRMIGRAIMMFERDKRVYPLAGTDKQGQGAKLSWRVQILPYLGSTECDRLYKSFHLDEAWDSDHNKQLIGRMPAIYEPPDAPADAGKTLYLAVTGPDTVFPGGRKGIRQSRIGDGTANTLIVLEVNPDRAVVWTKPDDWEFEPQKPRRGLGGNRADGKFLGLFASGDVYLIPSTLSDERLQAFYTCNRGDRQDFDGLE